ncbi:UDP-3-O-acyl-N-acetylglucosamine deacetylase [Thermocrinis minervae]|uniref:UDP-3-O-acyl-N-acetylglucosamine deacetylase n=1 Tax=Thermocrinis minervae TaxID=381751 RepID=A0A1M6QXV0_9AQUI|nr:UDP-3-O-acyl-N-acetylglucosamine deacetylase [Thermocrinis minervae]SHK24953.1 UDP-3-O-[3-hydroxymyristoyl] N-acetylglucosamine deacetylase [Thermocrinis minervae]
MEKQATIREDITFEGIGLHTGQSCKIVLHPAKENTGIVFYKKGTYIPANYKHVVNTDHSTDLGKDGQIVKTVEHLMAVLYMLGIDNLIIEVQKGTEIPAYDGSGYHFYKELKSKVLYLPEYKDYLVIDRPLETLNCQAKIVAEPYEDLLVIYSGYVKGFIESSQVVYRGDARQVVFARTFCYDYEVEHLRRKGLAKGGSLKNAVVLGEGFVYNKEGLRSKDEPIRHKLLDLLGDLSLLGKRIRGKVVSYGGGHSLNVAFVKNLVDLYLL